MEEGEHNVVVQQKWVYSSLSFSPDSPGPVNEGNRLHFGAPNLNTRLRSLDPRPKVGAWIGFRVCDRVAFVL